MLRRKYLIKNYNNQSTKLILIKVLLILAIVAFSIGTSFSQPATGTSYKTAVGIRGLGTTGITLKQFIAPQKAVEGIVGVYPNAFSITVLLEQTSPAFDTRGLNWYYGIGGHIADQSDFLVRDGIYRREVDDFGVGVDGIFGIEYKIDQTPIAVSMDLKPFLEFTTRGNAFIALDPGLGIKVTF